MTVLIDVTTLQEKIQSRLVRQGNTLPEMITDRTSHRSSLSTPEPPGASTDRDMFDIYMISSWLYGKGNFLGFYGKRKHFKIDWLRVIREYVESIYLRSRQPGIGVFLSPLVSYIDATLNSPLPPIKLLSPEPDCYVYHCHTHFPCRDQILNLEATYLVGMELMSLTMQDGSGRTVQDGIIERIQANKEFFSFLRGRWESATPEYYANPSKDAGNALRGELDPEAQVSLEEAYTETPDPTYSSFTTGFDELDMDTWRGIVNIAWELCTALHETGRNLNSRDLEDLVDALQPKDQPHLAEVEDLLDSIRNAEISAIPFAVKNRTDKTVIKLLPVELRFAEDIPPYYMVAYYLAQKALLDEVKFVRGVDNPGYSGLNCKAAWDNNPIGALLGLTLLLTELPARVCWHSSHINLEADKWTLESVDSFMPVKQLELFMAPTQSSLRFVRDLKEYPADLKPHDKPIWEPRIDIIREALGPKCLGILTPVQAKNLTIVWGDVEAPSGAVPTAEQEMQRYQECLTACRSAVVEAKVILNIIRPRGAQAISASISTKKDALDQCDSLLALIDNEWQRISSSPQDIKARLRAYQSIKSSAQTLWELLTVEHKEFASQLGKWLAEADRKELTSTLVTKT